MNVSLKNKNFINLMDFKKEELEHLLTLAKQLKDGDSKNQQLAKKNIGLLFASVSTRTRISFQVAVRHLGGHAEYLNTKDLQLANHESMIDTANVMGRYLDALVVRKYDMNEYGLGRESLNQIAVQSGIPVINALDDKDHPCQVMADILTLKEKFGDDYKKKKLVFSWGYAERQKSPGVPHSMLIAGSILGMNMTFAYPEGFELDPEYMNFAKKQVQQGGGTIETSNDLNEATKDADIIYVKSWKALGLSAEEDRRIRNEVKQDWIIKENHFDHANEDAIFMNCLPIIRGEQAEAAVIDGPHSVIYDEAENRLHVQKAILSSILA